MRISDWSSDVCSFDLFLRVNEPYLSHLMLDISLIQPLATCQLLRHMPEKKNMLHARYGPAAAAKRKGERNAGGDINFFRDGPLWRPGDRKHGIGRGTRSDRARTIASTKERREGTEGVRECR